MTTEDEGIERIAAFEDSLITRRSLLKRIRNKTDEQSWREFFETYWELIYCVARV